jgi:hypothetical protein
MHAESSLSAISQLVRVLAQSGQPLTADQKAAVLRWAVQLSIPTGELLDALRQGAMHESSRMGVRQPFQSMQTASGSMTATESETFMQPTDPRQAPHHPQQGRHVAAQAPTAGQASRPGVMKQIAIAAAGTAGGMMLRDGIYAGANAAQEQLAALDKPDVIGSVDINQDGVVDFAVTEGGGYEIGESAQAAVDADNSILDGIGELFS